jgi:hypothetical protein
MKLKKRIKKGKLNKKEKILLISGLKEHAIKY